MAWFHAPVVSDDITGIEVGERVDHITFGWLVRWWLVLSGAFVAWTVFVNIYGSRTEGAEALARAMAFDTGDAEADLLRAAGPPTGRTDDPSPDCRLKGASHAIHYTEYMEGPLPWMGGQPSMAIQFCVSEDGKILQRYWINY